MTQVHEVGTIQKLVDLNQDHTDFSADIKVWSDDQNQEFMIGVADQTQIDNSEIDYKTVKGGVEINIKNDDGVFRNHYVALKANSDIKLNVDIELTPEKKVTFSDKVEHIPEEYTRDSKDKSIKQRFVSFYNSVWFKIFVICIIVLLYLYYSDKNINENVQKPSLRFGSSHQSSLGRMTSTY